MSLFTGFPPVFLKTTLSRLPSIKRLFTGFPQVFLLIFTMYHGNNRRPGAGASLLWTPPTGYNVNMALSRAPNEVHYLKRPVSELHAFIDTEANMCRRLQDQEPAYDRMVCEHTTMLSDHKIHTTSCVLRREGGRLDLIDGSHLVWYSYPRFFFFGLLIIICTCH